MILVTGGCRRYRRCLDQLRLSLGRVGESVRVIDLERFPFGRYPPHVNLRTYAWKPILLADLAEELGVPLLWLDAATVVTEPLHRARRFVSETGLYTPYGGGGPIRVAPSALARTGVSPHLARLRTRASGVCGFDPRRPWVRELLQRWKSWALDPAIQTPAGHGLATHQFEQALLSLLLYQAQERGLVELTRDELDISSAWPVSALRTRNKVANGVPLALDPLVRAGFWLRRRADVLAWRLRRQRGQGDLPTRP